MTKPRSLTGLLLLCMFVAGCSSADPVAPAMQEVDSPPRAELAAADPPINSGSTVETAELWSEPIKAHLGRLAAALTGSATSGTRTEPPINAQVETIDTKQMDRQILYDAAPYRIVEYKARDGQSRKEMRSLPAAEFLDNLRGFLIPEGRETSPREVQFKLFGVRREGDTLVTRQRLMVQSPRQGKATYAYGVVDAHWSIGPETTAKLVRFTLPKYYRYELTTDSAPLFDDITPNVLGQNRSWHEQLAIGMNTWVRRIDRSLKPDFLGYHGIAVGDINGDELEDVYLCQPGGLPNLLFRRTAEGTFADISAESGVDWLDNSTGALFVDVDNDSDKDLVVATQRALIVMENDGSGKFSMRANLTNAGLGYSPTAADFDLDGDLDLLVLRYSSDGSAIGDFPAPHPFYDAKNGGSNVLLENQGNFQFVDVTNARGMGVDNSRFSFAASWEDYDNDGDQDVYIANDFGPNTLLRNDRGQFVDVSEESGSQDWGFGMSATWADYDRDGQMDLYVSSMFSGAGNQLVPSEDFIANIPAETRHKYLKMVRGNSLLKNIGQGRFTDVTDPMSEGYVGWAWGSRFADLNNDGWEDLYVANGYISQPDKDDL